MDQPSRPFHERPEHPFAGQFTNYWAWRFSDALEALAATAGPGELGRRIVTVSDTLATSVHDDMAPAWRAFVIRSIGEFTAEGGPHLMRQRAELGGPGADQRSFRSILPESPAGPFMRDARARLPDDFPPAADLLVPPGWVAEPAGRWGYLDEVDVVYDPRRHEILYTPPSGRDRWAELVAEGWDLVSADRDRIFWGRDRSTPTLRALAGLDTKAGLDASSERPTYEAGQPVRWKQRGRNWRYGHLGDPPVDRDGSLRVFEEGSGSARTLRPTGVERQVRGPRGGRRWVPCDPAAWRIVVTLYERAGVEQVEGLDRPVEVFRQIRGPMADHPDQSTDLTAGAVSRALAYAGTHNEVAADHGVDGARAELVRITMVSHDTEIWLGWDGDWNRWVRQEDPRTAEAGAPEAVLDSGGKPDPLTLRDVVRRRPATWGPEAGMVAL